MTYIVGTPRNQTKVFAESLEDLIAKDNIVRFIDLLLSSLDFKALGFVKTDKKCVGRASYNPKDLLGLFIYGCQNKIGSSRDLEKETKRNIEVMWLLNSLTPDHNTINKFRKDNHEAIANLFKQVVKVGVKLDCIDGQVIAGDSTKLRAQNSKKNNYSFKKIDRMLNMIDDKIETYLEELELADEADVSTKKELIEKIEVKEKHRAKYLAIEKELKASDDSQLSTSDPDARLMASSNNIPQMSYNVQAQACGKHNLLIDYYVHNTVDKYELFNMVERTINNFDENPFYLFDKGYYYGANLKKSFALDAKLLVAIPKDSQPAPDPAYSISEFRFNIETNTYTCPEGKLLTTNNKEYKKVNKIGELSTYKDFKTKACLTCPMLAKCTKSNRGRKISRSEFAEAYEKNKENIETNKALYQRRQTIIEHPFGTIKRGWGFDHIRTKKTKESASAQVGIIFTAYNILRLFNILGPERINELYRMYKNAFCLIYGFNKSINREMRQPTNKHFFIWQNVRVA